ncbi:unnamed protein product [Ectocarpus fasciculatus]
MDRQRCICPSANAAASVESTTTCHCERAHCSDAAAASVVSTKTCHCERIALQSTAESTSCPGYTQNTWEWPPETGVGGQIQRHAVIFLFISTRIRQTCRHVRKEENLYYHKDGGKAQNTRCKKTPRKKKPSPTRERKL